MELTTRPQHALVLVAAYLIAMAWSGCSKAQAQKETPPPSAEAGAYVEVALGSTAMRAEVVRTREEHTAGLSGRAHLPGGAGMLFVFDETARHGIWMPDMHFSVDILWLDEETRVVHLEEAVSPSTFPLTFHPPTPARYVLEVPSGTVGATGVRVGDRLAVKPGS